MDAEIAVALLALIGMEVVLGIDNLVFIAILSNRLPEAQRVPARRIGLGLAVLLRFAMLAGTSWLLTLTRPLFEVMGSLLLNHRPQQINATYGAHELSAGTICRKSSLRSMIEQQ